MSSHRQITRESAKDLIGLFAILALIVLGMLAFQKSFRAPDSDDNSAWYYEHVAPPGSKRDDAKDPHVRLTR